MALDLTTQQQLTSALQFVSTNCIDPKEYSTSKVPVLLLISAGTLVI